ncbi:MAG: alcohol dehydrogenase [Ignavibacteriae bacterium HGW-Ignavibacteriae-2]|jgi:2-desacetyl-2-hydroxyethyl bacteriochlorophyllide A dehydrogenase|nr:MAG: alcohol dehydrogenase [Ignavibacteriae bacterium HGW-Ignavibacteriae-2]
MIAAIFNAPHKISVEEYSLRSLTEGELLIRVNACGVCGTDHHINNGEAQSSTPVILGHEYAGTIIDCKGNIGGLIMGDKVAVDPNINCGYCSYCREGKINFCENLTALGVDINGGFAQFSIIPFKQAYKLNDNIPLNIAAYAEPLSCCLHGIEQAEIKINDTVVIVGAGSIGLLMVQLAKLSQASKIIVIEPEKFKRELAIISGADLIYDSTDKDLIQKIMEETNGGADIIIECAGTETAVNSTILFARKGATIILFGLSGKKTKMNFNLQDYFKKELIVKGSLLNPFTFSKSLNLLSSGHIDPEKFTTNQIDINEIHSVFSINENSRFVKYQIIS